MRKLDNWLDSYMTFVDNSEPPLLFHKWTGMVLLSAALQRKCYLPWGPITFYPNLYVVLVSPAGMAKKGTAMRYGRSFLEKVGIKPCAENITREALIRALKERGAMETVDIEGGVRVESHSSITVWAPELTVFLGYNNLEFLTVLTDWFDCADSWVYETKNMGKDNINNLWVTLFGATTPQLMQSSLPKEVIGSGFTSRIIFVYEENIRKRCPIMFQTPEELILEEKLIDDLQEISMCHGQFGPARDFLERWVPWYMGQDSKLPTHDPNFASYISRRPVHLMKLCMLLNISRNGDMRLEEQDFDQALLLLEETEKKMWKTFGGLGRHPKSDIIHDILTMVQHAKVIPASKIQERLYREVDKVELMQILVSLEFGRYVRLSNRGKEGVIVEAVDKLNPPSQIDATAKAKAVT